MDDLDKVIGAFTAEQVVRITGLSAGQLRYWDKTGFFEPHYALENRRSPYSRIYSFKDVVGLKTISVLKNAYQVSMPHLKDVANRLAHYSKAPWADIKLFVWKRKVHWFEPETGKPQDVAGGQYVMLEIIDVMSDVKRDADRLQSREESEIGQISRHRFVAHNRPVFAGTRIPVEAVKRFLEAGYDVEAILREYPTLTADDVRAAKVFQIDRRAA